MNVASNNALRLSIIVPVYNVEKWLLRCLNSLYNQNISEDEFEVIVVNDGSPDNSLQIANDFARTHINVVVVSRENGGLAAARNTGIEAATGKYVWFVDSDDHVERNCIGTLVNHAENNDLDILCFGIWLEYPDGRLCEYKIKAESEDRVYKGSDFMANVDMPASACVALYRRDFIEQHQLRFYEGVLHEDQEFTPRAYCLARRISFINLPVYYYYQRGGGIMKSKRNEQRCRDLLKVADSLYAFAIDTLPQDSESYNIIMSRVYFCVTQSLAYHTAEAMDIEVYKTKQYYPFNTKIVSGSMTYKLMLANISLRLYKYIYKLLK